MSGWVLAVDIGDASVVAAIGLGGDLGVVELPTRRSPAGGAWSLRRALDDAAAATPEERAALAQAGTAALVRAGTAALGSVAGPGGRDPVPAPDRLVLVHPAGWSAPQFTVLRAAAAGAALPVPEFVAKPIAAARRVAADLAIGADVAVLDIGARTIDMLVVRRTPTDFAAVGTPGSVTFDGAGPAEADLRRAAFELLATIADAGLEAGQLAGVHVIGEGTVASAPAVVAEILGVEPHLAPGPATTAVLGALTAAQATQPAPSAPPAQPAPAAPAPAAPLAQPAQATQPVPGPPAGGRRRRYAVPVLVTAAVVIVVLGTLAGVRLANRPARPGGPAPVAADPTGPSFAAGTPAGAYVVTLADIVRLPGSVIPVDPATNTTRKPIAVGSQPNSMIVTADGRTGYVGNTGVDTVTPIDLRAGTTGKPIKVENGPDDFAVTPDGRTVYVANAGAGTVTPIDTRTNTAGAAIPTGKNPGSMTISRDGKTIYVVTGAGTVVPIDAATNKAGPAIPVGEAPVAIVLTPDGRTAYILDWVLATVTPVDTATRTARPPIKVVTGVQPSTLAITPDGRTAYVASETGTIMPIDTATDTVRPLIQVGGAVTAIAFTPDGATALVADYTGLSVRPVDVATGRVRAAVPVGFKPTLITVSGNGEIAYVAGVTGDGTAMVAVVNVRSFTAAPALKLPGRAMAVVVTPTGGPASDATPKPSATAPAGGPGAVCGSAGSFDGRPTELVITAGQVSCAEVLAVLAKYNSPAVPKQGSAGIAEFDGWQCGHHSVAEIDATGLITGCGRDADKAAFMTRIASP